MYYLKKARKYIANNTIDQSKKCRVHLTPETGWLNDPNGFSYFAGKYHMFYQFNPYSTKWDSMHWGHATSDDCVKWEYQPVALAPMLPTASGKACYSGSAIEIDNKHYLIFTQNGLFQKQCIAYSEDGIDYKRINKPVISQKHLPKHAFLGAFRDPKVWQKNGMYYALIGSKNFRSHKGCNVILYKSKDFYNWQLVGKLFDNDFAVKYFDDMAECPDFFELNGKDVVIVSPWRKQKVLYMIGKLDYETGKFIGTTPKLLDYGTDFFATQSIVMKNSSPLLTAWAQPTISANSTMKPYGFNGLLTLPRKIDMIGDTLTQMPLDQLENYRYAKLEYNSVLNENQILNINSDVLDIDLEFDNPSDGTGITLYSDGKNKGLKIYYNQNKIFIDRTDNYTNKVKNQSEYIISSDINLEENKLKLRIVLDRFIVEVFVNDGKKAFSTLVAPTSERLAVMLTTLKPTTCKAEIYKLK